MYTPGNWWDSSRIYNNSLVKCAILCVRQIKKMCEIYEISFWSLLKNTANSVNLTHLHFKNLTGLRLPMQ
jgi:hypothetical protein